MQIEFYGDFDGKFHKSLELDLDLSAALLGHRSTRYGSNFYWSLFYYIYSLVFYQKNLQL